jgi:hypothetical protein
MWLSSISWLPLSRGDHCGRVGCYSSKKKENLDLWFIYTKEVTLSSAVHLVFSLDNIAGSSCTPVNCHLFFHLLNAADMLSAYRHSGKLLFPLFWVTL